MIPDSVKSIRIIRRETTMERRARELCRRAWDNGSVDIAMEWRKSRDYGHCPAIIHNGEKAAYASGCGYDKESQALADCLRFLGLCAEEERAIWKTGGAGFSSLQTVLNLSGWSLTRTAHSGMFDGFRLERKGGAA